MHSQSIKTWCTEYVEEIHDSLRQRECDRFVFEFKAPQMAWRAHIIQYMLKVAEKHKLGRNTVHLAIYFSDIFLDNHNIRMWRLHLVALTSIRIAAKIEEKDFNLYRVGNLTDNAIYDLEDYNILESIMLKMFDWDINLPTVSTFGLYFVEFVVDETDFNSNDKLYDTFDEFRREIQTEMMRFMDLSLFEVALQHDFLPSKLAAMCLVAARFNRNIEPIWTEKLMKVTRYTWDSINPDYMLLFNITLVPRQKLEADLAEKILLDREHELD